MKRTDVEMATNCTWRECDKCGKKLASYKTMWQHKKTCKYNGSEDVMMFETARNDATGAVEERKDQRQKNSQWSSIIENIINKKPENENEMIKPLKSSADIDAVKKAYDNTLADKDPAEDLFSAQETAKNLTTTAAKFEEGSEDERIIGHPTLKKRKVNTIEDFSLLRSENSKPSLIDELNGTSFEKIDEGTARRNKSNKKDDDDKPGVDDIVEEDEDENDKNSDGTYNDMHDSNGYVLERGGRGEESDNENISKDELKARLYREVNNMRVFELNLDADEGLTNIDIFKYIDVLKVPKFRGVFMRDELPKRVNPVECGIVNLSAHEQLGTHWVCYGKIHNTRIYFDSFGRKVPLEIQKYLKTAEDFRNNAPTIERNTTTAQRLDTKICGHLCLFVLTSLMREHLSFQHVMDQLNYAFSEHYY